MDAREAWQLYFFACIVFLGLFCLCIPFLLGFSCDVIVPWRVGILFSKKTQLLREDKVYGPGRYWVGLGYRFIDFSTRIHTVKFHWEDGEDSYDDDAVTGRTYDGLSVTVNLYYQYRLKTDLDSLLDLYYTYGKNYENVYNKVARSVIRDILSEYDAFDLVANRDTLSADMHRRLNASLFESKWAEVTHLSVLNIDLPDAVEAVIGETVVAQQDVLQAGHEYNIAVIAAETGVQEARIAAREVLLAANATVVSTLYKAQQQAAEIRVVRKAEADAFGSILCTFQRLYQIDSVAVDNSTCPLPDHTTNYTASDLLSYVWIQNLQSTSAPAIIGWEKPSILTDF
uniref:Band 7 domain-containing protein n=1 Tax=Heterosigma akashiwo TaxID=2829 RepID=A0A6V1L8S3_HETAK|mmetsp:Transcript_52604/g.76849  ORF Transcript_52604/g.76849 Transcript_52604/m.76849 type:complete len:342 (-) Transcript_52604:386-1411(-)